MGLDRAGRILGRGLGLRCPRCGRGRLFGGWFRMRAGCDACGLTFEREPGYFVGAIYLNYGATVAAAIGVYLLLGRWPGLSLHAQVALLAGFTAVFPLLSFRHSKGLWLALDHLIDPRAPGPHE